MKPSVIAEDGAKAERPVQARWSVALDGYRRARGQDLPAKLLDALGGAQALPTPGFFEMIEQMAVPVTITDADHAIVYANSAFETLSGYKRDALIGQRWAPAAPDAAPEAEARMREAVAARQAWSGRLCDRREDGGHYIVDLTVTPICAADGALLYVLGIHEDATALHALETRLANQKALTEAVINSAPVMMALVGLDRRVILDNLAYKTLMGDLDGREPAAALLAGLAPILGEDLAEAARLNRTAAHAEIRLDMPKGRPPRWFSCAASWVKDGDAPAPEARDALLLVCADITRQRAEHQRAQTHAVRAMMVEQQMTASTREILTAAAYQLQAPLNVMQAVSTMLARQQRADPAITAALGQLRESTEAALSMLRNSIPNPVDEAPGLVNINALLRDVMVILADRMSAYDVAVDWSPSAQPLEVIGRPNALRNLFRQLLDNAIDAIHDGDDGWRKLRLATKPRADRGVEVVIEDSGPGIARDQRAHVFEPFYSAWTKAKNRSGMGLAIARQVAADHGGGIEMDDQFRHGCRMRVFLPGPDGGGRI